MILYSIHLHPGRGTKRSLGEDRPLLTARLKLDELHLSFAHCVISRSISIGQRERKRKRESLYSVFRVA